MTDVFAVIFSLPFLIGMVCGVAVQRAYCWAVAKYEDHAHPLPNGKHHRPASINRVWLAGIMTFVIVGYILFQVDQTEQSYRTLARNVAACQEEFNEALIKRAGIAAQNDRISIDQRELLARVDTAEAEWVGQLINPPPDIAELALDDPARDAWNITVTRVYVERIDRLNSQVADLAAQQRVLDAQRRDNPLPEPTCGVVIP